MKKKIYISLLLLTLLSSGCSLSKGHVCPFDKTEYYHVQLKLLTSNYKGHSKCYYGVIPIKDYKKWKNEKDAMIHIYYVCSHANYEGVEISEEKINTSFISSIKKYDVENLPWGCFE